MRDQADAQRLASKASRDAAGFEMLAKRWVMERACRGSPVGRNVRSTITGLAGEDPNRISAAAIVPTRNGLSAPNKECNKPNNHLTGKFPYKYEQMRIAR